MNQCIWSSMERVMIEIVSKGQSCRDHREWMFFRLCLAVLATVFVTLLTPKCCWITCLCVLNHWPSFPKFYMHDSYMFESLNVPNFCLSHMPYVNLKFSYSCFSKYLNLAFTFCLAWCMLHEIDFDLKLEELSVQAT